VLLGAVALASMAAALAVHAAGAFNSLELKTIDARFHIRGTEKPRQPIVIIGLDTKTFEDLNLFPGALPRRLHARLIDRLHRDGARLIAYDIQFIGRRDPADDGPLTKAISTARPVLLATSDTEKGYLPVPAGQNARSLGAVVASAGAPADSDGIYRHMLYEPVVLKTLPVKAAELVTGKPVAESNFPDNEAWIDYAGPPGTFREVPFSAALSGAVPAKTFRGKIVLVGDIAPVLQDIAPTPESSSPMAGPEIQANALATILDGFPLGPAPGWLNVVLILVLSLAAPLLAIRLASLFVLGVALLVAALFVFGAQLAFNSGSILAVIDPLFGLVLGTGGTIAADALVERRQRKRLEEALGRLLPKPTAFFISYRRDDTRWPANSLRAALAERFGPTSVFMDTATIAPGQEWPTRIEQAIRGCSVVLVLIGPRWLERDETGRRRIDEPEDWVRQEIVAGLRRGDAAIVPVLVEATTMPAEDELPDVLKPLARRHAIILSAERYNQELDEFVDAIERGLIQDFAARQAPTAGEGEAPEVAVREPAVPEAVVPEAAAGAPEPAPPAPAAPAPVAPDVAAPAPAAVRLSTEAPEARLSPEPPAWPLAGVKSHRSAVDKLDHPAESHPDPLNAPRRD
jgi:CHASE2 domain-containing sensor protein